MKKKEMKVKKTKNIYKVYLQWLINLHWNWDCIIIRFMPINSCKWKREDYSLKSMRYKQIVELIYGY